MRGRNGDLIKVKEVGGGWNYLFIFDSQRGERRREECLICQVEKEGGGGVNMRWIKKKRMRM